MKNHHHNLPFFFSFSFFIPLLSFLLHHTNTAAAISTSLVQETCRTCAAKSPLLSYDFCVASLTAVPQSQYTDVQGLGIVSLDLAIANASNTCVTINKMLNGQLVGDNYTKICLEDCLELYTDAIPTLEKSVNAFKYGDYTNVNIWVSAAMEAATTCEEGFEEQGEAPLPLKKENNDLFQLCDIGLVISKLLSLQSFMAI